MKTSRLGIAAIAACAAFASSDGWADSRVGVTSAVNPSAAGAPPGADARQLTVGSDIVFRERVITTTDGQAQILFLDQSSLLIGPNSTVVIDEFVYDPATNKGNIAATLTQGSFRYIGGKLSKQGNATLKTPVATLGIRGSDVTVGYDQSKSVMNVVTTHGAATLTTQNEVVPLRSGFGLTVSGNSAGQPTALSAQQIAAANSQFEGQAGKSGGAGKPPTDGEVAKSGLAGTVEAKQMSAIETAGGSQPAASTFSVPFAPTNNDTRPIVQLPPDPPSAPQAVGRTDRLMSGYVAGFAFADPQVPSAYAIANTAADDVVIHTIPDQTGNGRVSTRFVYAPAQSGPITSALLTMGDPPGSQPATKSTFLDDSIFEASQAAGSSSGAATIDGAGVIVVANMISVPNSTPVGAITGDTQAARACDCTYVSWGTWNATMLTPAGAAKQVVPIGLWVAGVLPNVNDPSPQGSARFSGTAIGVVESQSLRFASGAFTNDYNFTQRSGVVTISNFDGKTFSGTVTAGNDWRSYNGALAGAGLNGTLNGSFYGNRTAGGQLQTPKETAGNFNVHGTGYAASGIFLGSR